MATLAFYGPTADHATKLVVGIALVEGEEPRKLERWFAEETDARTDARIANEVAAFLEAEGVRSVVMADGLLGCPHEEGIDYPLGESCPACPYWAGRNRFTGERER